MQLDGVRTVLVVGERPQLWFALSASLDGALVRSRYSPVAEAGPAFRGCRPWPWLLAGSGDRLPGEVVAELVDLPVPVWWYGPEPEPVPPRLRRFRDWRALVNGLVRLTRASVEGLRLAPDRGVRTAEGRVIRSCDLEGLLACAGEWEALPRRSQRNARHALAAHRRSAGHQRC